MLIICATTVGLVTWALHLMQRAVENRELSLMLAGFLVASAAAALLTVYFLMGSYWGFLEQMSADPLLYAGVSDHMASNWQLTLE